MMARFNCLVTLLVGRKKKSKDSPKAVDAKEGSDDYDTLHSKAEELVKGTTFGSSIAYTVKEVGDDNLLRVETAPEAAYEGGDEHDETLSMKRDFSDFDLQAKAAEDGVNGSPESFKLNPKVMENKSEGDEGFTPDLMIQSGHVSDPGIGRIMTFWGSPVLKRSCSNIETKRRVNQALISPTKSHSYNDLRNMMANAGENLNEFQSSPLSVLTNRSADKVMLKKRSSSQMLPSRSRKLWWKLFLWSHRNLHNPQTTKPQSFVSAHAAPNQKGGYSSDTIEPTHSTEKKNNKAMEETGNGINTGFLWPQNQWVAFTAESSPVDRVNAWVNSLEASPSGEMDGNGNDDEPTDDIVFPSSPEIGEPSGRNRAHGNRRGAEEVVQANNIIQSLNMLSSVAHISGMGLKVVPAISAFSSLRAINLSGNFIVHITPGTLPKSLHTLDLSRNKIAMIEGLRDLTRLRVLNLSYNRISRIGHGLSSCTLVKELYLAGNKISDVEGLHRLLKLTVLDLSFNKITTPKALGQLVANYNSLLALNLLGNPIQSNIGDDQLRKSVTGLLPQLTYLNKQPIKPQRVREVATDSVAKAALGNGRDWSTRRRMTTKRLNQSSSSSSVKGRDGANYRGLGSGRPKSSGHRLKTRK